MGFVFVRLFWAVVWECSKNLDQHRGSKNRVVKELVRFGIYMSWLVIWIWGKVSVWFPTDAVTKYHKPLCQSNPINDKKMLVFQNIEDFLKIWNILFLTVNIVSKFSLKFQIIYQLSLNTTHLVNVNYHMVIYKNLIYLKINIQNTAYLKISEGEY